MSRNLPIRVTISLVFRYIVWQFITLIINYKEIVLDSPQPHQIQSLSIYPMTSKSLKFRNDAWTWIGSRPLTGKLEQDETLSLMSSSQRWKFVIHGLTQLIFPFLSYSTPRILVLEKYLNDKHELRVWSRIAVSKLAYINPPHPPLSPFPPPRLKNVLAFRRVFHKIAWTEP